MLKDLVPEPTPSLDKIDSLPVFEVIDEGSEVILWSGSSAKIVSRVVRAVDYRGTMYDSWPVIVAMDDEGERQLELSSPEERELFEDLDVGVREFGYFMASLSAIDDVSQSLPEGGISRGFNIAARLMAEKIIKRQRQVQVDEELTYEQTERLRYAQRDLTFALTNISAALSLGGEGHTNTLNPQVWYGKGVKTRNSGYNSTYTVCNDVFDADDIDHASQISEIEDDLWPDEFHYPGKLEIRVDPLKRIEFIYTPEIETVKSRHVSHSTVREAGRERVYSNDSLSIRIDLDSNAPNGVALDIGRSAYSGHKDDRTLERDADLLGGVFGEISDQGSHESSGFSKGATDEFRNFAERLAVQLDLQNKVVNSAKLASAALSRAV